MIQQNKMDIQTNLDHILKLCQGNLVFDADENNCTCPGNLVEDGNNMNNCICPGNTVDDGSGGSNCACPGNLDDDGTGNNICQCQAGFVDDGTGTNCTVDSTNSCQDANNGFYPAVTIS